MRRQREHDQVGVQAVQAVLGVGVEARQAPLAANVVHDLVLALTGHIGVREDDLDVAPAGVVVESLVDVVLQRHGQVRHEGCARCNHVRVERLGLDLVRHLEPLHLHLLAEAILLELLLAGILGGAEAARALLVHLGARRDAVDGHVEQLARPHHAEEPVDVREDVLEHLRHRGGRRPILRVEAGVDDAIHVQVQVVPLPAVGVGLREVRRHLHAIDHLAGLLDHVHDDQVVFVA
mmetsp:Transcript_5938/g.21724  ORF Transcript_5938/g.21724 Transcript_5938/m.21724 type:complete len:235 (+) Transcript_5938:3934-4638(+)